MEFSLPEVTAGGDDGGAPDHPADLDLDLTGASAQTLLHSYVQAQADDKLRAAVELASEERSLTNCRC